MSNEDNKRVNNNTLGVITCFCLVLAPFTLGLSLLFLFGIFLIVMVNSQANERRTILNEAMVRSYRFEQDEQQLWEEMHSAYIFPSRCQNCGSEVMLCKVKWVNDNIALCPYCDVVLRNVVI